jgi:hypothetical protein
MSDAAQRVAEFLRQWQFISGKYTEEIYEVYKDPDGEMANLTVSDLRTLLANQRTPAESEVLRTAQAEYLAGHRSDRAAARDPAVVYTAQDRAAYSQALYDHYTAVRALIRSRATAKDPDALL